MRRPLSVPFVALVAAAALAAGCGDGSTMAPAPSVRARLAPTLTKDGGTRLLTCAAPDSDERAAAFVDPLGGTMRVGRTKIDLPAGAVPEGGVFEVVVPARQVVKLDVHPLGGGHYQFRQPITITIDYSRCDPDALPEDANPQVVYVSDEPYEVLERMGGKVDRAAQTITFTTSHLSGYAVAF